MGTGIELAPLAPYALAGAGAYTGAANEASAARKRDRQTAAGIAEQVEHRNKANALVNQNLEQTASSNSNESRQARLNEYLGTLQQNKTTSGGQVGAVSSAYDSGVAAKDAAVGDTSSQLANVLSRVDAAGDQRRTESQGLARTASDVGVEANLAQGDEALNTLKVNAIQANPWVNLLGKALSAAGAVTGAAGGWGGSSVSDLGSVAEATRAGTLQQNGSIFNSLSDKFATV